MLEKMGLFSGSPPYIFFAAKRGFVDPRKIVPLK
jgi:hypothetical protein